MMLSAVLMLHHLGKHSVADRIENAVHRVYREGRRLTRDVGGSASTEDFTSAVISVLA